MGLSASQFRYLSLTARQSDLEYQAQMISQQRITLANKTSAASKAYTEAMNNKAIRRSFSSTTTTGTTTLAWEMLTFSNILEQGCQIIGTNGTALPSEAYTEYDKGTEFTYDEYMKLPASERSKCQADGNQTYKVNSDITAFKENDPVSKEEYDSLVAIGLGDKVTATTVEGKTTYTAKENIVYTEGKTINSTLYNSLTSTNKNNCTYNNDGTYTSTGVLRSVNSSYSGTDIQTLLVSGQAQIVTNAFYQFLCEHGYNTGSYYDDNKQATTYEKLVDQYQANNNGAAMVIDWRSDTSNMFKQDYYTEDDAAAYAKYEAETSEIQAQDKQLELQLKQIETEHKAVQTEMESVKKVIDKNIESTFKTFS